MTSLFLTPHKQIKRLFLIILIPVSVTLFLITLPTTSGVSSFNFIKAQELNYPREVKLPLTTSWKISSQVFSNAPILGTGPSTFLFDFTKYKPSEFNSTQLWDSSFNTAADEFLQVFATLGLLGVLVFIWISLVVLLKGLGYLVKHSYDESPASSRLMQSLALMSLVAIALMLLHALTLVSTFVTLVILAAFMTYQLVDKGKFAYYSLGFTIILGKKSRLDLIPIILFALCLASVLPVWKRIYNIAAADYYHHLAVNDMRSSGALAYRNLQMAETLNGKIDLYRVDLAQTNLGLADAIAKQKIYQASASSYLSASDEKTIQILLAQAISEAKAATTLSPLSANNWAVLGAVYKDIIKLSSNATTFALDAYHHAMDQDPLNPSLRVDAGNIYYSVKAYSSAIELFQQAINLKSDYAPAFYALSLTYRDKGDLQNAEAAAEQAVSLLAADKNSPDYKIAYANLAALKSQAASVSAAPASSSSKVKSK